MTYQNQSAALRGIMNRRANAVAFSAYLLLMTAIITSDAVPGALLRASLSVWLAWAGIIDADTYFAFCSWSLWSLDWLMP
jgi:hypothetical protein